MECYCQECCSGEISERILNKKKPELHLTDLRDVTAEFKRNDTLLGDVGQKDAFVHVINANGPTLLQYHVSASCKVFTSFETILSLCRIKFLHCSFFTSGCSSSHDKAKLDCV